MIPAAVAVVVPAHNEEDRIGACLRSVRRAAARVAPLPVVTVVAADACTDATAVVAARAGAHVVRLEHRSVGAARAAGTAHALHLLAGGGRPVWLAMTDADTTVPDTWLTDQIDWARQGHDVVLGTIRLAGGSRRLTALHDAGYFRTRPAGTGRRGAIRTSTGRTWVSRPRPTCGWVVSPRCPPARTTTSCPVSPRKAIASPAPTGTPSVRPHDCAAGPPTASRTCSPPSAPRCGTGRSPHSVPLRPPGPGCLGEARAGGPGVGGFRRQVEVAWGVREPRVVAGALQGHGAAARLPVLGAVRAPVGPRP